jgi:CheY-like chemotaxis protein
MEEVIGARLKCVLLQFKQARAVQVYLTCASSMEEVIGARSHVRSVTVVSDGLQAYNKVTCGDHFDIIFMDNNMPIMDGVTCAQKIRQEGFRTPIIALTANCTNFDKTRYFEAGMSGMISKPFKTEELIASVMYHTSQTVS